jgi:hypothetical protein
VLIVNRSGDQSYQSSTVFSSAIPEGDHNLTLQAFTGTNGTGTEVATATLLVAVTPGQTTSLNVSANLQTTIQSLTITPVPINLEIGEQLQLTATARDAASNVLLLPQAALSWSVPSGGAACSVSGTGLLTGLQTGQASVRVAEVGGVIDAQEDVTVLGSTRVFFQTDRAGPDEIWSMNEDGSGVQPLAGSGVVPIVNQQGNLLVFTRFVQAGSVNHEEIYSCRTDGSMQQRLTFSQDAGGSLADNVAIAFDPAGFDVLIFRNLPGGGRALSLLSTITTTITDVTLSSPGFGGTDLVFDGHGGGFSQDGQWIYYIAMGIGLNGGGPQIFKMQRDGSGKTQVVQTQRPYSLEVSPDGTKLVFSSEPGDPLDLYVCNADGTGLRSLAAMPGTELVPKFTADGDHVIFTSNREGQFEVYTIRLDGTELTRLTDHQARDTSPSVGWGN